MAEEREAKNPVQSAERIFQVMETLADHGEMGLMELEHGAGSAQEHCTQTVNVSYLYGIRKAG